MEITPTEYDVIVIGTGITECIVAAACSRIGKTVLHVDINRFYGEQWSSFTLSGLEKSPDEIPTCSDSTEFKYEHFMQNLSFHNILEHVPNEVGQVKKTECSGPEEISDSNKETEVKTEETAPKKPHWNSETFQASKRRINIDITPKLCYSAGSMVELLRDSNCSRYLEFKAVNRSFVHHEGELIQAPCNREQVFNCKHLKVLEKRIMMKFVTFALQVEEGCKEFQEWDKKGDLELYKYFKLTDGLVKLVRASLVMSNREHVSAHEAIRSIKHYLKNVGIYGSMPFICPVYGSGELPQAFARFSAVFGSIYVLDLSVSKLNFDDSGNFCGLTLQTGQSLSGNYCVISPNYSSPELESSSQGALLRVSHAVYLTDSSIYPKLKSGEQDDISLIHILSGCMDNDKPVTGFEFGPRSCLPAEDMYMIHLTTLTGPSNDPKSDLEEVADRISSSGVLYKLFFTTQMSTEGCTTEPSLEKHIIQTSFPTYNVAYSESIEEARKAFRLLYPEEEFLPAAPNPEDIKWPEDDEGESQQELVEQSEKITDEGESQQELVEQLEKITEEGHEGESQQELVEQSEKITDRLNKEIISNNKKDGAVTGDE